VSGTWRSLGFSAFPPNGRYNGFVPPPRAPAPPSSDSETQRGEPPSTYAVLGVIEGDGGAALRLAGLTVLRGVFIVPGLWVASRLAKVEMTPMQLVVSSFGGSATISLGMIAYYAIRRATEN